MSNERFVWQVTAVVHPPPRDGKRRDYCFVHFADHAVVQKLIADGASGNKPQLEGAALDVSPPIAACLAGWANCRLCTCLTWPTADCAPVQLALRL